MGMQAHGRSKTRYAVCIIYPLLPFGRFTCGKYACLPVCHI